MRKTILILVLLGMSSACVAGVQLHIRGGLPGADETTTQPVTVLCQGDEYSAQVVCDGDASTVQIAGLEGVKDFTVSRTGTSSNMMIINGKRSSKQTITYQFQPLETGTFTVGPAMVDGEKSNVAVIKVVDPRTYDRFAGKSGSMAQALACSMSVESNTVYVGQPFVLTITIEDSGDALSRGLQPPAFGKLKCTPIGQATSSQSLVNGRLRVVTTQQYSVSSDVAGAFTIGPAYAHFVVPDEQRMDPFAGFLGSFFSGGGKKRSVKSNSVMITVKPLPPTYDRVDAIGEFTGVKLLFEKKQVELNEPISVTYTISGKGNFDALLQPRLDVPDAVSVYNSSQKFVADPDMVGGGVKTFEYLVQLGQPGEHEIASQSFVYFDTTTEQYETLYTEPATIQVKPAKIQSSDPVTALPAAPQQAMHAPDVMPVSGGKLPVIPWYILLLLAVCGVLFVGWPLWSRVAFFVAEKLGITSQEKRDSKYLDMLIQAREVEKFHTFFVTILARIWKVDTKEIDGTFIQYHTAEWEWDGVKRELFAAFIDLAGQAAFAPQLLKESERTALLEKARYWHALVMQAERERGA